MWPQIFSLAAPVMGQPTAKVHGVKATVRAHLSSFPPNPLCLVQVWKIKTTKTKVQAKTESTLYLYAICTANPSTLSL